MPNILQMQEILKGIPDNKLMEEMQQPSGSAPSFLVMTELERRKKVRDEYQGRMQQEQTTVAEDIVAPQLPQGQPPASGGIASLQPQAAPPMAPPMRMESGGDIYMQTGGGFEREEDFVDMLGTIDRDLLARMVEAEAGGESEEGKKAVASVIVNRILSGNFPNTLEGVLKQPSSGDNYQFSPLNDLKGDLSKLGEATEKTEDVIEELLMDFGNQNPVGNAVLFQNPDLATPFPIMDQDKSAGKKIGKHVFLDRYSINDVGENFSSYYGKNPVEEIATVNNQQIPELAKKFNLGLGEIGSKIGDGIASLLSSTDSPDANLNVAEIDQSASVVGDSPQEKMEKMRKMLGYKSTQANLANNTAFGTDQLAQALHSPDVNRNVAGYDQLDPDPVPVPVLDPVVASSSSNFYPELVKSDLTAFPPLADQTAGRSLIPKTVNALPPNNALPPGNAPTVDNSYADMIEQLNLGREDAKNMGLLTAGLGIMQQASQPGATLLSSIPGAAAGIKQYGADTDRLAKRQLALATLANQKRTADIAARKASQLPKYQAARENYRVALLNGPDRDKYFDSQGRPKQAFEDYVISKVTTTNPFQLENFQIKAENAFAKYQKTTKGIASLRKIKNELKTTYPNDTATQIADKATKQLKRDFMSGIGQQSTRKKPVKPIYTFNN